MLGHAGHDRRPDRVTVVPLCELLNHMRTEVRGHHHHAVSKIHGASVSVGQPAVLEHLEKHVEDVGMRLLHFVEKHDRPGTAPNRLGQVSAFLEPYVSGWSADETCDRMLLHEFGHVHPNHRILGIEQELRQRPGELGLADPGRAEKQERAVGTARVGEPGARPANRVGDGFDRLVLTDHPRVQRLLHAQQLVAFTFEHPGHRNAGPLRHDAGDLLLGHRVAQ